MNDYNSLRESITVTKTMSLRKWEYRTCSQTEQRQEKRELIRLREQESEIMNESWKKNRPGVCNRIKSLNVSYLMWLILRFSYFSGPPFPQSLYTQSNHRFHSSAFLAHFSKQHFSSHPTPPDIYVIRELLQGRDWTGQCSIETYGMHVNKISGLILFICLFWVDRGQIPQS